MNMGNQLLRLRDFTGEVKCAEGEETVQIQILRTGVFNHPWYGQFAITTKVLDDMVRNFDERVRRQDIPIDYFHRSDLEAAGWFVKLSTNVNSQGQTELWGTAKLTPKAKQMLSDKEVRYFSADFCFEWTDDESGVRYDNVLFGGGLVNRPFVKDMEPLVELSERENSMKSVEQLQGEIKTLNEKHEGEVKKLGEQITAKDTEIATLKGEKAALLKEKEVAEKEGKFAKMLSEGKACAAQKDAYMAGDMDKFMELAQPLNPKGSGSGNGGNEGDGNVTLSAEEKAACKLLNLSEEEFIKYNKR